MDDEVLMAKTCSTCRFALFGNSDYHSGGKRQGGRCLLHADTILVRNRVSVPKVSLDAPWHRVDLTGFYYRNQWNNEWPTEEMYLDAVRESLEPVGWDSLGYAAQRNRPASTLEEVKEQLVEESRAYYQDQTTIRKWWEDNKPKMRDIHRQTVCGSYEYQKGKESQALNLANKKWKD